MAALSPRPILKRASHPLSNHDRDRAPSVVHFPPSHTLTSIFSVYPSSIYDRSPIVVGPNSCALPERGCPGRTYTEDGECHDPATKRSPSNGRHSHPRLMGSAVLFADDDRQVIGHPSNIPPSLVPDLSSSESDESDGLLPQYPNISKGSPLSVQNSSKSRSRDPSRNRQRIHSPSKHSRIPSQHDSDEESTSSGSTWCNYNSISEKSLTSYLAVPDEGCFGGF